MAAGYKADDLMTLMMQGPPTSCFLPPASYHFLLITYHFPRTTSYVPLPTYHFLLPTYHFPCTTSYVPLPTYHFLLPTYHFSSWRRVQSVGPEAPSAVLTSYILLPTYHFSFQVQSLGAQDPSIAADVAKVMAAVTQGDLSGF